MNTVTEPTPHKRHTRSTEAAPTALPLRGLAMILLAVALVLILWGAFTLVKGGSDRSTPVTSTATSTLQTTSATQAVVTTATSAAQPPVTSPVAAPAAPTAPAVQPPQPAPVDPAAVKAVPVRVLNNSTITGLAAKTAESLRGRGWNVTEVGNLATTNLPHTAVYFAPGDAVEEQAARDIAAQLHGVAVLPTSPEVGNAPGVTVVLTNEGF